MYILYLLIYLFIYLFIYVFIMYCTCVCVSSIRLAQKSEVEWQGSPVVTSANISFFTKATQ